MQTGDLLDPNVSLAAPALQADFLLLSHQRSQNNIPGLNNKILPTISFPHLLPNSLLFSITNCPTK